MTPEFQGKALPLDMAGIEAATDLLKVGVAELVAVARGEAGDRGGAVRARGREGVQA